MNKRLGRGLDALIPQLNVTEDDKVQQIPLVQLRANPYQPRKQFEPEALRELADSIKEHGVIQPIIVRKVLRGYEIIAGERRWRASQLNGAPAIPAVVKELTDRQVMEIALIENVQREDLNAIEIATAYQALIEEFNLTQEELSARVGKSRSHIANFLRLLQLPQAIKDDVSRGTLSMGHARALVGIEDEARCKQLAKQAMQEQWSVRELEEAIRKLTEEKKGKPKARAKAGDPFVKQFEEQLRERFGTAVAIKRKKQKGRIEIAFYSDEDLERLLQLLQVE